MEEIKNNKDILTNNINRLSKNNENSTNYNQKYILLDDINDILILENNNIIIKFEKTKINILKNINNIKSQLLVMEIAFTEANLLINFGDE